MKRITLECNRCGHQWTPNYKRFPVAKNNTPKRCPSCKSQYWNKPRVRKSRRLTFDKLRV